jgi:hypothetical protein
MIFKIFYSDETGKKEYNFVEADIPYEALQKLIEAGNQWLVPTKP